MSSILREKMLIQQLDNTNEKVRQLERTARWWNDCTVSWREKWGRVNIQKEKLEAENLALQGRNKALIKEYRIIQNENDKLRSHICNEKQQKQIARVKPIKEQYDNETTPIAKEDDEEKTPEKQNTPKKNSTNHNKDNTKKSNENQEAFFTLPDEFQNLENVLEGVTITDHPWTNPHTEQVQKIDRETYTILHEKLMRVKQFLVECTGHVQRLEA